MRPARLFSIAIVALLYLLNSVGISALLVGRESGWNWEPVDSARFYHSRRKASAENRPRRRG